MQPEAQKIRQSSGPDLPVPRSGIPPGGPITESAQGDSASPHDRGVEENTNMSKGTPNPMQSGSMGDIGDIDGWADRGDSSGMTYGGDGGTIEAATDCGVGSTPTMAPPAPDDDGMTT